MGMVQCPSNGEAMEPASGKSDIETGIVYWVSRTQRVHVMIRDCAQYSVR